MPRKGVGNYPTRPCSNCGAPYQERPHVRTCSRKCGARLRAIENPQVPSPGRCPGDAEVAASETRRREVLRVSLDSGATREIPLHGLKAAGRVAFVDADDYDLVMLYRWSVLEVPGRSGPYAITRVTSGRNAPRKYMHQLITGYARTDHWNHDGLDNRRENLRDVTARLNLANQRPRRRVSSRYKGVAPRDGKWEARIKGDGSGKVHILGRFITELDAALAYDMAARRYFGQFACLNFPEGATP